jgi:hypothetical protein
MLGVFWSGLRGIMAGLKLETEKFRETRDTLIGGLKGLRLAGIIFLRAPFHFKNAPPGLMEVLTKYFGDRAAEDSPLGLLQRAKENEELNGKWPRILVLCSELDPVEILRANKDFACELARFGGVESEYRTLQGHNHISPPWALGTGVESEERWGDEVGQWCSQLHR